MMTQSPRHNVNEVQLFAAYVERHFGIESDDRFDSNHFEDVNQFIEDNHKYFILLKTQMITDLMWEVITSLWAILRPNTNQLTSQVS